MMDLSQAVAAVAEHVQDSPLGTGAVLAIVTTEAIEWVKRSGFRGLRWINVDTATVNRLVGGVVAFLTGLGITMTYDPSTGTLIINGLLAGAIAHGVAQWAQQQLYYRLVVSRSPLPPTPPPAAPTD